MNNRRTYLDYNASAPLRAQARLAMLAALDAVGNASSVHWEGRRARALVEDAREQLAAFINARPSEVVFTSGATEANNWVLRASWDTIFVAGIEHESVLACVRESRARIIDVPVDRDGVVRCEMFAEQFARNHDVGRALAVLQLANNETGVVQPVAKTAACAEVHGIVLHSDAVQAIGRVTVNFAELGVDYLAISAHKFGGPKGIGALIIRDGAQLAPFIAGGGQERRRRAGTENVAAIAGFAAAAGAAAQDLAEAQRVAALRDAVEDQVRAIVPSAVIIGEEVERLANTSCIAVPGQLAETLVIKLDLGGVAVSAGSACSSGKVGTSHVLTAMGIAPEVARSAIRISLGPATTHSDIAAFLAVWKAIHVDAALAA
jgi:cysteine desulfurase